MGFNKRHNVVTVISLIQRSYAQMKRGENEEEEKREILKTNV